jgi:hypothetical protein
VTTYPRQLTQPDLDRLIKHTSALTEMRGLLPIELFIKLDTFKADLLAEQEDRTDERTGLASPPARPPASRQPADCSRGPSAAA